MAVPGRLLSSQKEEPSDSPAEWGPCKCVSEDRSQGREVRTPHYTWGVWGPVLPQQQTMMIRFRLAPGGMACLRAAGCRGCSGLSRALGLLHSPPWSHLPERLRGRSLALPLPEPRSPICEHPGSLEVGGEVTEAENCSFTSSPWAACPVDTGLESSSWRQATAVWLQGSHCPPQQQPSERSFGQFGTWLGQPH